MALQKPSPGLLPAENYARFGRAFDAIDAIGANVEVQVAGLNGRIDAEGGARVRNVEALQQQIASVRDASAAQVAAETEGRQQADAALRSALDATDARATLRRTEFVSLASRPGDAPLRFAFVSDLAALSGPDQALPVLPDTLLAFGDAGTVARVRGAGIVATRQAYPVEPGRAYAGRFAYQRRANPSDPSNDSVRAVLVWLDQARNVLPGVSAFTVVEDDQTLLAVSGRQEVGCSFARSAGAGLLVAPAGARYVRLVVQCFGLDGLTDVEVIDRIDTTEATLLDPVSTEALARIADLESDNPGPRLLALEQQAQAPNSLTFATRSDAAAGTIPGTVTTVATRGRDAAGDGRDGIYRRVASLPAGSDSFTNTADGSRWLRVLTAQDVFDATFQAPFMDLLGRRPDMVAAFGFAAAGASTVRTLAQRAADRYSVRDFGAKLDGATNDLAAFNAARAAAGERGAVDVPAGALALSGTPTAGSADPILWRLSGNYAGGFPLTGIGRDVIETFIEKGKYFGQGQTAHGNGPVLRVDQRISHAFTVSPGGPAEAVIPAFKINQNVEPSGRLDDFPWAFSVTSRSKAYGSAQVVGLASQMIRPSDALDDGQGPRSQIWGSYIEVNDETNQPSNLAGAMVGIEMGLFANSGDPGGARTAFDIGIGRRKGSGTAARFNRGLHFGSSDGQYGYGQADYSFFGRVVSIETNFDTSAFDTTGALAIGGAPAIRLRDGHKVAFDTAGQHHLRWENAGLRYTVGDAELFNILDDGSTNVIGILRAASGIVLPDGKQLAFDSGGAHALRWAEAGLRYTVGGVEVFNILDDGKLSLKGPINIPDQPAPGSTGDGRGVVGDEIRSGAYLYRKTSGGWQRIAFSTF